MIKSFLEKINSRLDARGGFLKSISILVGGTAFAQALGVLVLPIITRIYSPAEFAIFAVYSSIVSMIAVTSCLRFQIAIPLPKKDEDALCLFLFGLLSNIVFTSLIIIVIFLFEDQLLKIIKQSELSPYIWFIPIGVFLSGLYGLLQYWTTRKKQFSIIAKTRMTQSITSSLVQISGGYFGYGVAGLILGQVINFSAGIIKLCISFWKESKYLFKYVNLNCIKKNWKQYDKFPKYSTFEAFINSGANQLPIIIIAAVSIGPEAGYLMLAMKVMAIPISLIGSAIAQVYLAHAPEYYYKGELIDYTIQTIKQISKIAIIPLVFIGCIAPFVFPIAFGSEWAKAGYMLIFMIPWFTMQIISSPVSMSLHVVGKQKAALVLQIIGFSIRVGGLILICMFYPKIAFEYYAFSSFIFYCLYLAVILNSIKKSVLTNN